MNGKLQKESSFKVMYGALINKQLSSGAKLSVCQEFIGASVKLTYGRQDASPHTSFYAGIKAFSVRFFG